MVYTLMNKNTPILDAELDSLGNIQRITDAHNLEYLPLGIDTAFGTPSIKSLNQWWSGRCIPASRSGLRDALELMEVQIPGELLLKNLGLSLSDQYWISPQDKALKWEDVNFFQNDFTDDVGSALFAENFNGDFMSPNNTSDGWLKKKWMIQDGKRVLLKTGSGESQQEPLNEVLANCICRRLGIENYVPYNFGFGEDYAYSICENFITEDTELVTANMLMKTRKKSNNASYYQHYIYVCQEQGIDISHSLDDMLILDFIICNQDRHYNNFGLIRNVNTLKVEKAAPVFDTGTSAFCGTIETRISNLALNPSKPFRKNHEEQLAFVQEVERYDFTKLKGIEDEFNEILKKSPFITQSRRSRLVQWLGERSGILCNYGLDKERQEDIVRTAKKLRERQKKIR